MVQMSYERLVEAISKNSGLNVAEVEEKVEAKERKISGLISKEGAAQIVAAELGVTFDKEKVKINEISPEMRGIKVIGKVINVFPVRKFTRNGKESKVANLIVADETSNTRVVLWDTNHIQLLEEEKIKEGTTVEISNANIKENEIHLGSFSEIRPSEEKLGEVRTEKIFEEKDVADLKISNNVDIRAFIVQAFEPRFFNVCTECKKKVTMQEDSYVCNEHGKNTGEKRALINLVLDDGTETIRAVLFHEAIPQLGLKDLENPESLNEQKQDLLGKEMIFSGTVRLNKFFNNPEIIVESVKDVNVDELINKLEK